jgi:hypothetical protein
MQVTGLASLLAIKMLGLVPGLNSNDRRVATVLLEHFNRRTGQCDPGLNRIAQLLGISTRTVIRCNHKLESAGLFRKTRHGGTGNRNDYEPIWSRFSELERGWRTQFKARAATRKKLSRSSRQNCHILADKPVTQTFNSNLNHETFAKRHPESPSPRILAVTPRNFPKQLTKRSANAARDEAERRWLRQLDERFRSEPETYSEVIDAITPDIQAAATNAELERRGAGIAYIFERLDRPNWRSSRG